MSYSDIEHFSNMISGCENINAGDYKSGNSVYVLSVLKLHANDAGIYAGQEGFLDVVKKGTSNIKEWITKLINAILDFVIKGRKQLREAEEYSAKLQKEAEESERQINNEFANYKQISDTRNHRLSIEGSIFSEDIEKMINFILDYNSKIMDELEKAGVENLPNLTKTINSLQKALRISKEGDISKTLSSLRDASVDTFGDLEIITKILKSLSIDSPNTGKSAKILSGVSEKYASLSIKIGNLADKISEHKASIWDAQ
jgi:predicted S18 family serine protease